MKGYRFYEELTDKNRKAEKSTGNVVAVHLDEDNWPILSDYTGNLACVSSVYFDANSPCVSGGVSREYLEKKTRRVSEAKAREIHPNLFRYLEKGW